MEYDLPSVDLKKPQKMDGFNFEEFIFNFRKPLTLILCGLILIGIGVIAYKSSSFMESSKVEILESKDNIDQNLEIVVEVSGSIEKPGVYKLKNGSRIDDLLIASGGFSVSADREWIEKYINRASKLTDGQKTYIPQKNENTVAKITTSSENTLGISSDMTRSDLVNINTASQKELEELPGIGPVYAQSIIEKRIYSSVEELLSKGALKKSTYEKIKDMVSIN